MSVADEQSLFRSNGEWTMVEAPRMSMRELYSRFGAATRPPPAAPLAAPPTGATAQITVQQSGHSCAMSVGFVDLDTKVEAQQVGVEVDIEAGAKPAGGSPLPSPSVKAAPPPLSRKMKASLLKYWRFAEYFGINAAVMVHSR